MILTLEQTKAQWLRTYVYSHWAYEYKTEDWFWHLIRNWVDVLDGKEAVECDLYDNLDYKYQTKDWEEYYITNIYKWMIGYTKLLYI